MYYNVTGNAFSPEYLDELKCHLLTSPHIGPSPLGKEFVDTLGFSLVFKRSSLDCVFEEFSYLEAYLNKAIFSASNAFYVNPLILGRGSRVDQHVDCRLVERDNVRIIPNIVSILYVHVDPNMQGGCLHLNVETNKQIIYRPVTNDLVHFLGTLVHSVEEMRSGEQRICIVCEQYNLCDSVLESFPEFNIVLNNDHAPRLALSSLLPLKK